MVCGSGEVPAGRLPLTATGFDKTENRIGRISEKSDRDLLQIKRCGHSERGGRFCYIDHAGRRRAKVKKKKSAPKGAPDKR